MSPARSLLLAAGAAALQACAAAPAVVKPAAPAAPAPAAAALALVSTTVVSQSSKGAVLRVSGTASGPDAVSLRVLQSAGSPDERTLASTDVVADGGRFDATVPVTFGTTVPELAPYQTRSTVPLVVEAVQGDRRETRALVALSPRLPVARIVHAQATSPEPGRLEMTLLLGLANPNPWDVRVGTLKGALTVAGHPLAPVSLTLAAKLPASSEGQYELPVLLTAADAGGPKAFAALLHSGSISWRLTGALDADGLPVLVDQSGAVKVSDR